MPTRTLPGYRMPAEWELHDATWISWPHNRDTWPGKFESIEPILVKAVRALASSEPVFINVLDEEHEQHVKILLSDVEGVIRFFLFPTDDAWCRDHGAVFVVREKDGRHDRIAIDWEYNAWGNKYPPFDLDNDIPRRMAKALNVPRVQGDMVLEGGSIEVNGAGLLLTTTECLLNPNRNPDLSQQEIESRLMNLLGVKRVFWLKGELAGDDTDGHIDNLVRFVRENTVLAVTEEDVADANYEPLRENLSRLQEMKTFDGRPLSVRTLPMPDPVYHGNHRLPASYANFFIGNRVVLLPTFGCRQDACAKETLQQYFPRRRIVDIDCTDLIWGLGAFHCLTQQVPV